MTTTLKKPAAPPKRTRAEWDEFIRQHQALDGKRKRLDRESAALKKQTDAMAEELLAFVEHECPKGDQVLTLKSFILSIRWQDPSGMAMAFAALKQLAADQVAALKASLGRKKKLDVQWRDAPPEAAAA